MGFLRSCTATQALAVALLLGWASTASAAVVLITVDEAKLPPSQEVAWSRGITRAPRIEVSDSIDGQLQSPFHFKLGFRAFGGSAIDPRSVIVNYLRKSEVDLTPRVRAFVRPSGIDIPDTEAPPGEHTIRVLVQDTEGRQGVTTFTLHVVPQ